MRRLLRSAPADIDLTVERAIVLVDDHVRIVGRQREQTAVEVMERVFAYDRGEQLDRLSQQNA